VARIEIEHPVDDGGAGTIHRGAVAFTPLTVRNSLFVSKLQIRCRAIVTRVGAEPAVQ
jgi:hypothetical protein